METFKTFLAEEKKPYDLLVVSHDGIDDVNETGPLLVQKAEKLGMKVFLSEIMGSFMEDTNDGKLFYSYKVDDKGVSKLPTSKEKVDYEKPFKINPEKTLIMMRGLHPKFGCESWNVMAKSLEHDGYKLINSVRCNSICNDKWYNQIIFQRNNIPTPKTVLVRHAEDASRTAEKLNNKYPMILKTSIGSTGVGVMFVESEKSLNGIVQLLYRENKYIDILLQEYIKTDYDVRAIVVSGKVLGSMKRPIVDGDFRSNVSQGSKPEIHQLTKLEESETLRAADAVGGDLVGVDFIPAKDREKEKPLFIEVNSNPGLMGIEKTLSKNNFSITEEILNIYMNRENWRIV